jgi:hypothetical protein
MLACDGVKPATIFQPVTDPGALFMRLTLDHRAINLSTAAPYDTFRLTATPRNGLGEPITGLPAPVFRSTDTARVWVTPDGLLRARRAATRVAVIAELAAEGNVRHEDTAYVNVTMTSAPPSLSTFSISPEPPAKLVWPIKTTGEGVAGILALLGGLPVPPELEKRVPLRALDPDGKPVPGLVIEYRSSDPAVVEVDASGNATPNRPGDARIVARTVAYGVAMEDTAEVVVTLPRYQEVRIREDDRGRITLQPAEVRVLPNGYVLFRTETTTPVDITFDVPDDVAEIAEYCAALGGEHCGGGNIPAFAFDGQGQPGNVLNYPKVVRGRRFLVPGIYTYRSTLTGLAGRVVVTDGTAMAH